MLSIYQFVQLCKSNNIYSVTVTLNLLSGKESAILNNNATTDSVYAENGTVVWNLSLEKFYQCVDGGFFETDIDKLVKKYKLKLPSKL